MEIQTLTIAIIASFLVFCTKPVWSLVIYCAILAWYPPYLTVKLGTVDFNACRIIIIAIFMNILIRTDLHKKFKLAWLDKLVIIYFICQILAGAITSKSMVIIENRLGAIFDMALPYFAFRIILTNKNQYFLLLKSILIITAPLACLGFYQSITGHNVAAPLKAYAAWTAMTSQSNAMRRGFYRANVIFSQPIMFGLLFAMLGPICAGLLCSFRTNKVASTIGIALMGLGVFSSMSSGPFLAAILATSFLLFYHFRRNWKTVSIVLILMCGSVETISNRHFYDVLGGYTFSPSSANYRSRLIDVALFEGGMADHWIFGYGIGHGDPGWGPMIDRRGLTDIVNHYILILYLFGLVGLIPLIAIIMLALRKLIEAYKACTGTIDQWLVWCLAAALFGLLATLFSVSLFGPPRTIFFILLALCGSMPMIVKQVYSLA